MAFHHDRGRGSSCHLSVSYGYCGAGGDPR
jgi:hypothetical protein